MKFLLLTLITFDKDKSPAQRLREVAPVLRQLKGR